ncbi:MAG TPA: cytochrome c oxidase subunit 3 [Actinomycetota bacterium]|nr:cytochrome c oxidase subunit 3 [Actinomycetota bacterium]
MTELAQRGTDYGVVEQEEPEVLARNLISAGQLLASATVFFFLAFFFAYFYLRSVNNAGMWKPKHVDASVTWGTIVMACIVLSAMLVRFGRIDQAAGRREGFRLKALAALVLGLAALGIQAAAWTQQPFGPSDGGFASVYFGWTAFIWLFVLATMFWLETALATSWRYRNEPMGAASVPPGHASGDPGRLAHDIRNPVDLNRAELGALSFYWTFLAGIAVVTWIVLYLV